MSAISLDSFNVLSIVSLVISIITVIIGLDCVWRTEHKLDTYLKLLTSSVAVTVVVKVLVLVGFKQAAHGESIIFYTDLLSTVLIFLSFAEMYRIIRILSNENNKQQP